MPLFLADEIQRQHYMTDDFFDWDDRPVQESVIAHTMLEHAGFKISAFRSLSPDDDPPDCEGVLDGKRSAIEVTRLNHEKARALNMKARKENKPEVYFIWERDDLLAKLQKLIDKKESGVKRYSGGPYDRYVLVLHADEMVLTKAAVEKFMEDATFRSRCFTDVVLGLSYEPGGYPAFRLKLHRG